MALTQVTPDVVHNVQSNITQVGTLSNLTVTNTIVGNINGNANNSSYLGGTDAASYALGSTVTTANTAMKGYVDAVTTAWTANAGAQSGSIATLTANAAVQAGIIASLTNYANANVTAYLPTHSGNVGASSLNLSANITFSSTNVPHRIRGDFSTSYTSVSLKNKVFFQSTGATDDTYIRVLGGGGGGIGGIQLYGTYDPDNSTILQLDSVPGLQSRIVSYASGTATAVPLRISAGSTDVVIGTSGLVEVSGEISTTDLTVTNTISGTANNALNLGGTPAAQYLLTHATAVTVSGASVNFTSIPSWAKRITVMFSGVSTSGSSNMLVRLGTSASVEATGYLGSQSGADAVGGIVASLETTGFRVSVATASTSIIHGTITLTYIGSNIWTATGITSRSNAAYITYLGGSKTLASTLTRVQITMSNGTDTFDAGTINIMYE